tara:strand:- start:732 stop:1043 length:312 start_codon:yes stop_codon:yes gene_type:complete
VDYFELREKLINEKASVKDLPMFKNMDRKGHEAFMYIDKKDFKNVDNLGKELKKIRGKFHVSSFDGLETDPKEVELYGDMKALQQIAKKFKNLGKVFPARSVN